MGIETHYELGYVLEYSAVFWMSESGALTEFWTEKVFTVAYHRGGPLTERGREWS